MLLSIIIPTYNRTAQLVSCIERLSADIQNFPKDDFEIIVSDDSENLDLKKIISDNFINVTWINGLKRGPASNRNNGAKIAKGDWLIFLDDDVIPDFKLLTSYSNAIMNYMNCKAFEGAIHPDNWRLLDEDMAECPINLDGGVFWSANICIKKSLFEQVDGFDEQFVIAAQEDQDIYDRIKEFTEVRFVSEAIVIHPVRIIPFFNKIKQSEASIINWIKYSQKYNSLSSTIVTGLNSQFFAFFNNLKKHRYKTAICSLYMLIIFPFIVLQQKHLKMYKGKFKWLSSIDDSNIDSLNILNNRMAKFYARLETRSMYDVMISPFETESTPDDITLAFLHWYKKFHFKNILEIGCGSGRIRKELPLNSDTKYTGTEVSPTTIKNNPIFWPDSRWVTESVYDLDFSGEKFDLIFSFYVLEHLVFPKRALDRMYDLLSDNGVLVIVCPDFCETERFPSQYLGFSYWQSAKIKLAKHLYFDAFVSFLDSKFRLKPKLRNLKNKAGKFLVNANPICLDLNDDDQIWPDCDAVYLANKSELEKWAIQKNLIIEYPNGREGLFKEHIFLTLIKRNSFS